MTGIHRPEGIFMGYGSDIRKCEITDKVRVWEVAPTILHMMGLPIPSYVDGTVLNIFRPGSEPAVRATVHEYSEKLRLTRKIGSIRK